MHVYNRFRKVKQIISPTFASTTAGTANSIASSDVGGENFLITFQTLSGDIHIDPLTTATTTAFKLTAGQAIDMVVSNTLSTVSTDLTATYQAIVWEG